MKKIDVHFASELEQSLEKFNSVEIEKLDMKNTYVIKLKCYSQNMLLEICHTSKQLKITIEQYIHEASQLNKQNKIETHLYQLPDF